MADELIEHNLELTGCPFLIIPENILLVYSAGRIFSFYVTNLAIYLFISASCLKLYIYLIHIFASIRLIHGFFTLLPSCWCSSDFACAHVCAWVSGLLALLWCCEWTFLTRYSPIYLGSRLVLFGSLCSSARTRAIALICSLFLGRVALVGAFMSLLGGAPLLGITSGRLGFFSLCTCHDPRLVSGPLVIPKKVFREYQRSHLLSWYYFRIEEILLIALMMLVFNVCIVVYLTYSVVWWCDCIAAVRRFIYRSTGSYALLSYLLMETLWSKTMLFLVRPLPQLRWPCIALQALLPYRFAMQFSGFGRL